MAPWGALAGLARGDSNHEQGWVAVSESLNGTSHLVPTAPAGDYYSVKGWLNGSTLVLQSWGAQPGVWVVQADGSDLRRLADGIFFGWGVIAIPPRGNIQTAHLAGAFC